MQVVSVTVTLDGNEQDLERLRSEGFAKVEGDPRHPRFVKFANGMEINAFIRFKMLLLSFSIPSSGVRVVDMIPFSLAHVWDKLEVDKLAAILGGKVCALEFLTVKDYTNYVVSAGWVDSMGLKVYTPSEAMGEYDMHYNRPSGYDYLTFGDNNVGALDQSYIKKLRKVGFPLPDAE